MQDDPLADQPSQIPITEDENTVRDREELFSFVIEQPLAESADAINARSSAATQKTNATLEGEIVRTVQMLLAEMQRLREDFDTKVKYDGSKERQIDSLHLELQAYREGLHFKILRPICIDLIAMHDDLSKLIENMTAEEVHSSEGRTIKNLQLVQDTIEEILSRNGVAAFSVDGNTFTPHKQRVIQAIDTDDLMLDKQIARRVRKGFEYDDRVLRPELVVTYKTVSNS